MTTRTRCKLACLKQPVHTYIITVTVQDAYTVVSLPVHMQPMIELLKHMYNVLLLFHFCI